MKTLSVLLAVVLLCVVVQSAVCAEPSDSVLQILLSRSSHVVTARAVNAQALSSIRVPASGRTLSVGDKKLLMTTLIFAPTETIAGADSVKGRIDIRLVRQIGRKEEASEELVAKLFPKVEPEKDYVLFLKGGPRSWIPSDPHVWFLPKNNSLVEEIRRLRTMRPDESKKKDAEPTGARDLPNAAPSTSK